MNLLSDTLTVAQKEIFKILSIVGAAACLLLYSFFTYGSSLSPLANPKATTFLVSGYVAALMFLHTYMDANIERVSAYVLSLLVVVCIYTLVIAVKTASTTNPSDEPTMIPWHNPRLIISLLSLDVFVLGYLEYKDWRFIHEFDHINLDTSESN